ncbi:MAG: FRG domain-containing protein, partial [Flavobacterium sp.]
MGKLNEYKKISDKKQYFQNGDIKVVINIDRIFDELDKLHKNGDFIFRGCSEAKYKLYNSAQRFYINNELYRQVKKEEVTVHYDFFVESLIEECKSWNNSTVKSLLKASSINEENSLAYLSYMQHFGVPTPFLDFTFNPYLALFFAIENVSYVASDTEIDNYFSIYYTYQNATIFEGWKHVFDTKGQDLGKGKISYTEVNRNSMHILLPETESYKILNNTNIINQEGLFFYNNHPFKTLEEHYLEFSKAIKKQLGEQKFKEMLMLDTFANCFNIHKSLI